MNGNLNTGNNRPFGRPHRCRGSIGFLGQMAYIGNGPARQEAHRGNEVRERLFTEPGRIIHGRFAHDYSCNAGDERNPGAVGGAVEVIIEKLTGLFREKKEDSMQDRAEASRRKKEADNALDEFNTEARNLEKAMRELTKRYHG